MDHRAGQPGVVSAVLHSQQLLLGSLLATRRLRAHTPSDDGGVDSLPGSGAERHTPASTFRDRARRALSHRV